MGARVRRLARTVRAEVGASEVVLAAGLALVGAGAWELWSWGAGAMACGLALLRLAWPAARPPQGSR